MKIKREKEINYSELKYVLAYTYECRALFFFKKKNKLFGRLNLQQLVLKTEPVFNLYHSERDLV